jgi:site-specific recombinase XerD
MPGRARSAATMNKTLELNAGLDDSGPQPVEKLSGELVSPIEELVRAFAGHLEGGSTQTRDTYTRALRRFARWLGPAAGPDDLTLETVAAYHRHLADPAAARSTRTIKKDRAALNSFVRFLEGHELLDARQAKLALSVKLPRARVADPERPKALGRDEYERLIRIARASDDALLARRDEAILLVLGDAGLRCEETATLDRGDFEAKRKGALLRALNVRHGKGDRQRRVPLSPRAARAIVAWERARETMFGPALADDPLFVTLGRRRGDGSLTRAGGRTSQAFLNDLCKRLGQRAGIAAELRHPHALRHTFATQYLRDPRNTIEDLRKLLGHANIKTTSIYLSTDDARLERSIARYADGPLILDRDRAT